MVPLQHAGEEPLGHTPDAGRVTHLAPISSLGSDGVHPQTPPHAPEFVDHAATPWQQRRIERLEHGDCSTIGIREVTLIVRMSGEVVAVVIVGARATIVVFVELVSVAVYTVSVAVMRVVVEVKVATLLHVAEISWDDQP